jgi:hypothetical protein
MAGGILLLGQAVASADEGTQTAGATNTVSQDAGSTGSGGDNTNVNFSEAEATNVQKTEVDTDVEGGDGGTNVALVNTGVVANDFGGGGGPVILSEAKKPAENKGSTTVTANTGDVTVNQQANGGSVSDSGNVAVASGGGNQTATATNTVTQTATSEDDDKKGHGPHGQNSRSGGGSHDDNTNVNGSSAEATNIDVTDVETDIEGGDGGENIAIINTGIVGNTFHCPPHSTCIYNFTTGDVTVNQQANGGSVSNSGNVGVNAPVPGAAPAPAPAAKPAHHDHHAKPAHHDHHAKPAHHAAKRHAAPAAHRAAVSPTAQGGKGQLAYTGAETSVPLTLGLLALGAGGALTLAGRRRSSTAAV